jgi:hypothetical protein
MTTHDEFGEALREMLAVVDPVPTSARAAASAALSWRDIDAQLATLTSDSLTELVGPAVRGTPPRLLTFATGTLVIDLEVTAESGEVRLLGQLTPAAAADVTIEWAGGSRSVTTDARGRFAADGLPIDWLRVGVGGADASRSRTEWFKV